MVERCPLNCTSRCAKTCHLRYCERNIEPDPCCRKLKRIRELRDILSLECDTWRDWHLLGEQSLLDVFGILGCNVFYIVIEMNLDRLV